MSHIVTKSGIIDLSARLVASASVSDSDTGSKRRPVLCGRGYLPRSLARSDLQLTAQLRMARQDSSVVLLFEVEAMLIQLVPDVRLDEQVEEMLDARPERAHGLTNGGAVGNGRGRNGSPRETHDEKLELQNKWDLDLHQPV